MDGNLEWSKQLGFRKVNEAIKLQAQSWTQFSKNELSSPYTRYEFPIKASLKSPSRLFIFR